MTAPTLTGFAPSITFAENTVNATPQLLDADVVFNDVEGDFDGGTLTLSGLLAEDRVSVRNEGTGAGQIGLSGASVTYGGVVIGTLTGGSGATLTITFNASATSASIDALIQNLTYANVSDTPTATRNLILNVTDAAGDSLAGSDEAPTFTERTGAANPFNGVDVGRISAPTFADLDGDGDLDAVVGEYWGSLLYFRNTGTATAPVFVGHTTPFGGVDVGLLSAPTFADLDGDGDLDAVVGENNSNLNYFRNTGTASAPVFALETGGTYPFESEGVAVAFNSAPTFADLDGDGDLDLVVGGNDGILKYFRNTGTATAPVFVQQTGAANPFNGVDVGYLGRPSFADLDGDGDLDAVVGEQDGVLNYFENTGTATAPIFTQRTGADNPLNGVNVGGFSAPTFADLDGDGDLDIVVGEHDGVLNYFENTTVRGHTVTVTVTAQNDAPTITGLPTDVTVVEDVASNLNLSAVTLTDVDTTGSITVVLTASAGTMTASSGGGVTVTNSGTGAITLTGTASAIDAYLNTASNIQYTGALNATGDNAATLTITANDGSGTVTLGVVNIDITPVNDAPTLTGFAPSITFAENLVNATPQLLDADVVFNDVEGNFNGGRLTLSGLLAEDRGSVRNEGTGAGQIGLSGTNVTFGGVVIGTLAGGSGATLTITFNAAATSAAIDALIQNLTYANVSDAPTASRDLVLNVTDAAGNDLPGALAFISRTGAANPINGDVNATSWSTPTFADLDGDGDLDALVGDGNGSLHYFRNTGTATAPVFVRQTGVANPFNGVDVGFISTPTPTFADLDGDGDLDAVVGERYGSLHYFRNTGTASAPVFVQQTGAANPFNGVDVGNWSRPAFADLDSDGDLDAVVGAHDGNLNYFENTGTTAAPVFVQQTGAANPFNGVNVGFLSMPAFADLDGDGDLDAVVGEEDGSLNYFRNTGTATAPVFTLQTGAANPFNGTNGGSFHSTPTFADIDGDGDLDAVVGAQSGNVNYFENTTPQGQTITVTVTPANDVPTVTGLPTDITVTEDVTSNLNLSAVTLTDVDTTGSITVVLTASAGTMNATSGGGVTITNSGTGAITLTGTVSAIDAYLNTASAVRYTGAANANGNNAATVTVTANDGSGAVTLGTVNVDIIAVNDAPTLTGFAASVTFAENLVNATPQLLDADVVFNDVDNNFNGGRLNLSGLLAEDRVSVRNEGSAAGQIGLSGTEVSYGGAVIGTLAGGSGSTLTITFNASATSAAIDALIQNLTYANVSDAPTATRNLLLNITDAAGATLGGAPTFAERTGAANPSLGGAFFLSPTFGDLDGDGDLDAVAGENTGTLLYFENTGTAAAPVFTARTGSTNPFNGVDLGHETSPTFVDIDRDGDLDVVVGKFYGTFELFVNTGTATAPIFQAGGPPFYQQFGTQLDVGFRAAPTFADLDRDGDQDAVIGADNGTLRYFENIGSATTYAFAELIGAANPFNGVDVGSYSAPTFADLDNDGDLDALVGERFGTLLYFENTGTVLAPVFTQRTGSANPFDGVVGGSRSDPTFADLDNDGDLDAVVADNVFTRYFENLTVSGSNITVTVTAQNEVPTASGLPTDVTVTEDEASNFDLSAVTLSGADITGSITFVLTASAGTMTASSGGGVTVTNSGTGAITLTGTAANIDAFLNTVSAVRYTGVSNANGDNAATLTITANDGSGAVTLGVVNIDITAVNDVPTVTGLPTDVTVVEDVASNLNLSAVTLTDVDTTGSITVVLTASAGTMTASSGGSVTVTNSGTGAITLTGTAANIDAFLNTASAVRYTGAANANGNNAATLTITANDGSGAVTLGVVNIDITAVNDAPTLTGFGSAVTFDENTVNATPQLLDADVIFLDPEGNFNGGFLTLSGLLAEDRVSVRNEGSAAGQIGLSSANVTFGGVVIGTLAGGSGATLTITFNASATSAAVDALIQNLTYANVSDAPTASRDLVMNVTDAAGASLVGTPTFAEHPGVNNPFNGLELVRLKLAPTFGDLDGDGDLDAVVGENNGSLMYFENTGSAAAPVFTARTGAANPFNGTNGGGSCVPVLADLDGDGDLDAVTGMGDGILAYFENTGTAVAPVFTARTGAANPFNGVHVGFWSAPTFADLDSDGDLDAVVGGYDGYLSYFENTGTAATLMFTARAANPVNGLHVGTGSTPTFADLDGDGDLDVVVGEWEGNLNYFENLGALNYFENTGFFSARTGAANPFNGVDVGSNSVPTFADLDGDGDLDIVVGELETLNYFENSSVRAPSITVSVTAQNDVPTVTGLPTDVTVVEDVTSNLNLSAVTLTDVDTTGSITVVLTASAGTMTASSGGSVTVTNSGTGAITLTGTAANIDAYLNTVSAVRYTGAANATGDNAATLTITANDGSGAVTLGTVNVDITPVNDRPTLTGFAAASNFAENLLNATPQLLDADVVFNDVEGNFNGGHLTLSGLLAEDRVSARNEGSGAGQIGLSGANVTYGGVIIGTLAGGSGATLTITFNAAASSAAIDTLIQNLTYANVSDTPTATRNLILNVTDGAGDSLAGSGGLTPTFAARTGTANPLNGVDVGSQSAPSFADLDGDGDLDAVVGALDGRLRYFENTGTAAAPIFTTERIGAANPFNGVDVGFESTPAFADLDGDGDLDAVIGERFGSLLYFQNTGSAAAPVFIQQTGGNNPFNGVGLTSAPTFVDLDADGDLDAVVGENDGTLNYLRNTGTATAPVFVQQTGGNDPFNGVDVGLNSTPTFADIDGDGDLDALVGNYDGRFLYYENTGTATAPVFTERADTANPFAGVDVGVWSTPTFADLDGDGDLDAVVGESDGNLNYFQNTTVRGQTITVTVTAQNDAPSANGLPTDVTVTEDTASNLNLSAVTLTDVDTTGSITVTLTASAGTMTASNGGGVTVTNSGTGAITLTGTVSAIDAFLNSASAVQYTGVFNANGDNAATVIVTANDGSGAVILGTVNVDITAVNDVPTTTGLPTDVTVTEDVASNLDLSAVSLADADSTGSITVVLTASAGTMTASSGGGVTVTNSGTGAITLTGTAADIDAFLNTASNIQYTGALNANGDNAATLTITANDGFGAVTLGTVNVDITAVNDVPTITGLPTDVTVTEDTASNLNLSAVTLSDVDTTGSITVVLTASAGTMAASSGGSVTVSNSGTGAITLTGTAADIDAFLNTASNIQYTGALNANGDNAATLTITANDGSGSVTLGVVNIDITPVNDVPTATGLPTDVTVTEDVASNLNLSAVTLSDVDTTGSITVVLTASAGTVTATSGGGVTVTNSGTGAITLMGTVAAIDAFLNTASNVRYTGPLNANGDNAATLTITANDGFGAVTLGVVNIDITPVDDVSTVIDLSSLTTSQGFVIQGNPWWEQAGLHVSYAGDVNSDGIDDVIVGAPYGSRGAYVIYGQTGASRGLLDLSTLSASQGFVIQGFAAGDMGIDVASETVSGAGDVNGDGIDDLIVGAPGGDDGGTNAGQAYVIYGQAGASRGLVDVSTLSASQGFVIQGDVAGDLAGWSVSDAGDVNGDGLDDLIVGARGIDDGSDASVGAAYVIYGQAGASRGRLDLTELSASEGFVILGAAREDIAGDSVSSAGDVNGDGIDDLIVGAPNGRGGGVQAGETYVIYGQAGTSRGRLDLGTLSASQGFIIQGDVESDESARTVSDAGDVNGDGIDDLIVSAPGGDDGGQDTGEAYVIYGQAGTSRGRIDLSALSPSEGFIIQGKDPGAWIGFGGLTASSAGDVNGDGIDDLIVGSPLGDDGGLNAGQAYVVYGQAGTSRGRLDLGTLSSSEGFIMQGHLRNSLAGFSVSSAGDVNRDGLDDLIVGGTRIGESPTQVPSETYVIYGFGPGWIKGTCDSDTLSGTSGADFLNGLHGDDVIRGHDGDDVIDGGYGNDRIFAGSGNDTVVGGVGNNVIDGGAGWDIVTVSGPASAYRVLKDGDNFILKGPDGGDRLTNVEAIRFADGKTLDLARMYGPDVDASAWADGRIPEELLSGEGPRPLVWVQETTEKDVMPEVLPAADDAGLDRFGEPGPLIGVSGGGSDPSIPLTLNDDSDDFLTVEGGMNDSDLLPGEMDGRVDVAAIARPQFSGDRVVPSLMNGRELRVEADGRMPEADLSDEKAGGDRPLVLPGADDAEPLTVKVGDRPEVLPGADDGDHWMLKDDGEPLVLPGADETIFLAAQGTDQPLVWVQEAMEKDVMPEVLPAADDQGLDRFGEPGPLIGVFGGGSDPSIPLTLNEDSDDFLTAEGGMNDSDLSLGDTDDRAGVAAIARPQFDSDRVVPGLMNGRERELRVEADGRISEADLSDEKAGGDRPLVLPGADEAEPLTGKDGDRPEVLPGVEDEDRWILKDVGEPLVLPGAAPDEVLIAKHGDEPEVLPAVDDVVGGTKAFDGPEVLPAAPVDKFLVEAEVLPPLPSDHFSAEVPEVLPALDDGFLVTGKFDDLPPVMPTLPDDIDLWDVAAVFRPGSETLALILEGAEHPYGHSLTLLDEGPAAPSKGDAWE